MKKGILHIVILTGLALSGRAQVDPHFSQFYANPLWLNPGLTGVTDGGSRFTAIYRNQWSSVMTPFTTMGISADMNTDRNLNLGVNFLNQQAGEAGYQYLNANISVAYGGVRFGKDNSQQVTIGLQAGLLSRRFDPTKFQYGDQWNPITGYDPNVVSGDLLTKTSSTVADVGAGISYMDGNTEKKTNFFLGAGAFHLTRPQDPFVANGVKQTLPLRFSVHGGARMTVSDNLAVTPHLLVLQQGNAREIMAGISAQYFVSDATSLYLGGYYRFGDAISPYAGLGFGNWLLGLSYDINASELGKAVPGTNALEFSLSFTGRKAGKPLRYLSCPRL